MTANNPAARGRQTRPGTLLGRRPRRSSPRPRTGDLRHRRRQTGLQDSEHHARFRLHRAVQRVVHVLRAVLRSRPRSRQQGRQRHGLHPAAARRSAVRPRAAPTNFMVLTRATNTRCIPARTASSAPPTTSTTTSTRPRPSSTRTRPTPRTPRTRSSCASTPSTGGRTVATGKLLEHHWPARTRSSARPTISSGPPHLGGGQGAGARRCSAST